MLSPGLRAGATTGAAVPPFGAETPVSDSPGGAESIFIFPPVSENSNAVRGFRRSEPLDNSVDTKCEHWVGGLYVDMVQKKRPNIW